MTIRLLASMVFFCAALPVFAAEEEPTAVPTIIRGMQVTDMGREMLLARLDLLVSLVERHNCRLHVFQPGERLLADLVENAFRHEEIRMISEDLVSAGRASRNGDVTILNTENCV